MHSAISKVLIMFSIGLWFQAANAQQVPVTDSGVESAVSSAASDIEKAVENAARDIEEAAAAAGKTTTDAINANGKLLGNINQALSNIMVSLARGQAQVSQLRANADLYDASMGAKAQSACGVYEYSVSRVAGEQARRVIRQKVDDIATTHIERGRYMDPEHDDVHVETAESYRSLIALREDYLASEEASLRIIETDSLPEDPRFVQEVSNIMSIMAVPFPVELDAESYDKEQTSEALARNLPKLITKDRQRLVTEVVAQFVADRAPAYDTAWAQSLLNDTGGEWNGSEVAQQFDESSMSRFQLMSVLNTYRLKNDNWVSYTSSKANEVGLARDSNIMQAQMLELMHEFYMEQRKTNLLLAYIYGLNIESAPLPGPKDARF